MSISLIILTKQSKRQWIVRGTIVNTFVRGYAIRLVAPNGVYRWVGCVFRDRNDAFDFNEKILKFISDREMERNPEKF